MTIKLRYKEPDGDISKLIQHAVIDNQITIANTSDNFRFSAAVAEFGLLLRNSEYKQQATYKQVISLAKSAKGKDDNGYRSEFIGMAESTVSFAKN
jgi:Ca-activated chloride channel family protein